MSTALLAAGLLVLLAPCLYMFTLPAVAAQFPTPRGKRICLLIAHPDDEAMFFAPTVLALTRPEAGNHVKILCLSSGNADGLGETRKKELVKSAMMLGLRGEDDVSVIEHEAFQDSPKMWDAAAISKFLTFFFRPDPSASPTIDMLVTFDDGGVSSHPNHVSLYHGARAFAAGLGPSSPLALYTLTTVSFLRKYASVADVAATLASVRGENGRALVFMNSLGRGDNARGGVGMARRTMTEAHLSQMLWFRYGWIWFSRYMLMNDLRLEEV